MARLTWDETEKRLYETGVDHVALFLMNPSGSAHPYSQPVAWNGITGITESPDGADANDIYADNIKYLSLISKENWKGTIKAYQSPKQFKVCEGEIEFNDGATGTYGGVNNIYFGQQSRQRFALAWRTIVGNASEGDGYGYKLHIAYGLSAAPSERDHATENDSPEATEFSWEINSIPEVATHEIADGIVPEPVSHVVIDSKKPDGTDNPVYAAIEAIVFDSSEYLMGIDDLIDEIKTAAA